MKGSLTTGIHHFHSTWHLTAYVATKYMALA